MPTDTPTTNNSTTETDVGVINADGPSGSFAIGPDPSPDINPFRGIVDGVLDVYIASGPVILSVGLLVAVLVYFSRAVQRQQNVSRARRFLFRGGYAFIGFLVAVPMLNVIAWGARGAVDVGESMGLVSPVVDLPYSYLVDQPSLLPYIAQAPSQLRPALLIGRRILNTQVLSAFMLAAVAITISVTIYVVSQGTVSFGGVTSTKAMGILLIGVLLIPAALGALSWVGIGESTPGGQYPTRLAGGPFTEETDFSSGTYEGWKAADSTTKRTVKLIDRNTLGLRITGPVVREFTLTSTALKKGTIRVRTRGNVTVKVTDAGGNQVQFSANGTNTKQINVSGPVKVVIEPDNRTAVIVEVALRPLPTGGENTSNPSNRLGQSQAVDELGNRRPNLHADPLTDYIKR